MQTNNFFVPPHGGFQVNNDWREGPLISVANPTNKMLEMIVVTHFHEQPERYPDKPTGPDEDEDDDDDGIEDFFIDDFDDEDADFEEEDDD